MSSNWPKVATIAGFAAVLGFGAARLMAPSQPAERSAQPEAAKTAVASASQASAPAGDEVKIPAAYLTSANIGVEAIGSGDVRQEILAPATVVPSPGSEAVLVAKAAGTIQRVAPRLGDVVRAGEVLATLESQEAASMAAERRVAQAKLDLSRKAFDRESSLFQQGVSPRQDMESAKAALDVAEAEAQRASLVARAANVSADGRGIAVVSPIAGRVSAQNATLGAYVSLNDELFRVTTPGAMQIEASVTAAEAGRIAPGDTATIVTSSGAVVPASVRAVTPTVSGSARRATVVLSLQAPNAAVPALVVGEGVQVRLHGRSGESGGLMIPEEAVQNLNGRDVLFVRTELGFRPTPVLVGSRSGGLAQIVSGIKAGERVATRNAFLVKAEAKKNAGEDE
ncbi:efflux RND transporter periplasmic adaptor subunit [Aquabacterium commune]|nr:efflux RND transporter periplasmic adaptor subunit [Aquabacterium commune]